MEPLAIHVVGDPTVDWLSPCQDVDPGIGPYYYAPDQEHPAVCLSAQAGGAALLTTFLTQLLPEAAVQGVFLPDARVRDPFTPGITRAWSTWRLQAGPEKHSAFRIADWGRYEPHAWAHPPYALTGTPDLLVVEDSGLGLRDQPVAWPSALTGGARPGHVIVKLAQYGDPAKPSPVFEALVARGLGPDTTVVTSLSDLRACAVRVGTSLSWERLFSEIVAAVYSPACPFAADGALRVRQVLVTINAGGAVLVSANGHALIFDRSGQEGDFERRCTGGMTGYNTAMVGALAAAWARDRDGVDWRAAARDGVGLARELLYGGYAVTDGFLGFPTARLAAVLAAEPGVAPRSAPAWNLGLFVDTEGKTAPGADTEPWTILEQVLRQSAEEEDLSESALAREVLACAAEIVRVGPGKAEGLRNVPVETMGFWQSADRHEIEGVRSVNNAMRDYLALPRPETPLAIAVFGPPGAGKSFAIKEIAKQLGIPKEAQLTFNLSQFESPDELPAAFQQIRDLHLKGLTPLVFWDEFDTPCQGRPLGWLRHFLAPIQDGLCVDRGKVHPTGGGIYVFAGGTCRSFGAFAAPGTGDDRAAKKPDFVSRLRAYMDVKGPNGDPNAIEDPLWMVRRAFLLHAFLHRHAGHLKRKGQFAVGDEVVRAFLRTGAYRHGARSMECIVLTSNLKGRGSYELSSLPPRHLLAMHVDAADFLALTQTGYREMLRIGVTGHIALDPTRMPALAAGIARAIDDIGKRFPRRALTVFSPLSEGADRLVAREVLGRPHARLITVLPVPVDEYIRDFGPTDRHDEDYGGAELRQEFRYLLAHRATETIVMPPCETRNAAYMKMGRFIAEHCDVLVAVWDGQPAQGPGGTGDVVRLAAGLGKPIVHVWAGNHKDDEQKRTEVGEAHGTLRYCWAPTTDDVDAIAWEEDAALVGAR